MHRADSKETKKQFLLDKTLISMPEETSPWYNENNETLVFTEIVYQLHELTKMIKFFMLFYLCYGDSLMGLLERLNAYVAKCSAHGKTKTKKCQVLFLRPLPPFQQE